MVIRHNRGFDINCRKAQLGPLLGREPTFINPVSCPLRAPFLHPIQALPPVPNEVIPPFLQSLWACATERRHSAGPNSFIDKLRSTRDTTGDVKFL
jgi:hypothetical protein